MQLSSDRMLPAPTHLRLATIALFFVVLLAVASIPIATHPLPPLSDYVNHLARTHVIDAIGTDSNLSRYYTVEWQIIPNLMIDLIVPVLHRFMSVYLAGQIFTIAGLRADRFRDACIQPRAQWPLVAAAACCLAAAL